jgi:hypothetical protein
LTASLKNGAARHLAGAVDTNVDAARLEARATSFFIAIGEAQGLGGAFITTCD